MVDRLKDRPFTLLGIERDAMSRSALKEKLSDAGVIWPNIVENDKDPIAGAWNVQAYPTLYVIDHEGVIRLKGERDKHTIAELVEKLLAEVPAAAGSR